MRRSGALVVMVLAAVLANSGAAPAATSTDTAADEQIARTGVLVPSDFPAEWKETPRGTASDKELDAQAATIPSCKVFLSFATASRRQPRARSQNLERGQSNVTNTVSVFPSTAKAVGAITTFGDDRTPGCLRRLFTVVYRREIEKSKRTAKQLTSVKTTLGREEGIRLGDDAVVYLGTLAVGLKNGTSQTVNLGFLVVRAGRALAGYSYTSDIDISAALQPAIVASVTRLQRAASG